MDEQPSSDDLREFLRLLTKHRVDFLLVGGFAVALHGFPRATADFDLWIDTAPVNIERVLGALCDFGFARPTRPRTHSRPRGRSCEWAIRRHASSC